MFRGPLFPPITEWPHLRLPQSRAHLRALDWGSRDPNGMGVPIRICGASCHTLTKVAGEEDGVVGTALNASYPGALRSRPPRTTVILPWSNQPIDPGRMQGEKTSRLALTRSPFLRPFGDVVSTPPGVVAAQMGE